MRIFTRVWRHLFDYTEIPTDSPSSLDDSRARAASFAFVLPVVLFFVCFGIWMLFDISEGIVPFIATVLTLAICAAGLLVAYARGTRRVAERFATIRKTARAPALAAGYTFQDSFAPPLPATSEAVFYQWRYNLVPRVLSEVITGESGGYRFTAGHLVGFEVSHSQRQTYAPFSENIVMIRLPRPLPEVKLRDRVASSPRDYGMKLTPSPTGDAAVDARWAVQSRFPALAHLFFSPRMRAYLASVPMVPCTMVIRNGYLISCRDPLGTFESITQRLDILTGLLDAVPAELWERETTAAEGGAAGIEQPLFKVTTWPFLRR